MQPRPDDLGEGAGDAGGRCCVAAGRFEDAAAAQEGEQVVVGPAIVAPGFGQRQRGDEEGFALVAAQEVAGQAGGSAPGAEAGFVGARCGQPAQARVGGQGRLVVAAFDEDLRRRRRRKGGRRGQRVAGAQVGQVGQAQVAHLGQPVQVLDAAPGARVGRVEGPGGSGAGRYQTGQAGVPVDRPAATAFEVGKGVGDADHDGPFAAGGEVAAHGGTQVGGAVRLAAVGEGACVPGEELREGVPRVDGDGCLFERFQRCRIARPRAVDPAGSGERAAQSGRQRHAGAARDMADEAGHVGARGGQPAGGAGCFEAQAAQHGRLLVRMVLRPGSRRLRRRTRLLPSPRHHRLCRPASGRCISSGSRRAVATTGPAAGLRRAG